MSCGYLKREIVLVLNRNWQAIHVKSPAEALAAMFSDDATGLDIQGSDSMTPYKWEQWVNLPYDENASYIKTVRGDIKIPKVIILAEFDKVPQKRPKFSSKAIWRRDEGICQYTGQKLTPNEGNIDHVIPRSKGGKTNWTNCVLVHKEVNARKADKMPHEVGLKLIRQPQIPKALPTTFYIKNKHQIREWEMFLKYE
jgi:5-methylcytosine-specific restriction endonuclease McrA